MHPSKKMNLNSHFFSLFLVSCYVATWTAAFATSKSDSSTQNISSASYCSYVNMSCFAKKIDWSASGGSGCKWASYRTYTGSFASPGEIERVSKIILCIGTKLCYCLQKLKIS